MISAVATILVREIKEENRRGNVVLITLNADTPHDPAETAVSAIYTRIANHQWIVQRIMFVPNINIDLLQ